MVQVGVRDANGNPPTFNSILHGPESAANDAALDAMLARDAASPSRSSGSNSTNRFPDTLVGSESTIQQDDNQAGPQATQASSNNTAQQASNQDAFVSNPGLNNYLVSCARDGLLLLDQQEMHARLADAEARCLQLEERLRERGQEMEAFMAELQRARDEPSDSEMEYEGEPMELTSNDDEDDGDSGRSDSVIVTNGQSTPPTSDDDSSFGDGDNGGGYDGDDDDGSDSDTEMDDDEPPRRPTRSSAPSPSPSPSDGGGATDQQDQQEPFLRLRGGRAETPRENKELLDEASDASDPEYVSPAEISIYEILETLCSYYENLIARYSKWTLFNHRAFSPLVDAIEEVLKLASQEEDEIDVD
ncbi:MAG: hypothetical protein Q9218_006028, partial [Villophora microphyllina]